MTRVYSFDPTDPRLADATRDANDVTADLLETIKRLQDISQDTITELRHARRLVDERNMLEAEWDPRQVELFHERTLTQEPF